MFNISGLLVKSFQSGKFTKITDSVIMCFMRAPPGAATMKVDATKWWPVNGITRLIIFRFHFEPIKERNVSKRFFG